MSSTELVMVTGGNGFVGYGVIVGLLNAGYHVRAAVRRQDAVDTVSKAPSVKKFLASGALTFTLVPDNTKPGAYGDSVKGCTYIVHVASPLATTAGDLVSQAVAGNKAILEAAEATPSVKRVVFTSSTASTRTLHDLYPKEDSTNPTTGKEDEKQTMTADTMVPNQPPVSDDEPGFTRYINSKIAARNLVHEYVTKHKSSNDLRFSVINILPGWVLGPEELSHSKQDAFKGSNIILSWLFTDFSLAPFLGLSPDKDAPIVSETVHLDDVVEAHVKALTVPGEYRNFLLCSDGPTGPVMESAAETVRRELPKEVADGLIPFFGTAGTLSTKFDASPSERDLLGHAFLPYEKMVTDTIRWYVHLKD